MKIVKHFTLSMMILIIILAGCSKKKNIIGDEGDFHPYLVEIKADSLFEYYYSFEREAGNYIRNTKSLVGHYNGNESITLLRFANLPDSGFVLTEDPQLTLTIKKQFEAEGMNLRFGLISQLWHHYFATWEKAEEEVDWSASWDDYSNISILEDIHRVISENDTTLVITLPQDLMQGIIEGWVSSEPESYGFALFSELSGSRTDSYLELYTRETAGSPVLKFAYHPADGDTTLVTYERTPLHNTFINSKLPVDGYQLSEEVTLANMVPTRAVFKLNILDEYFDPLPADGDLKKITVNRADLILFRDGEEGHFPELLFELYPYYLLEEYPPENLSGLPIPVENMGIINPTFTSLMAVTADSVAVNITTIIQAHISELKENYGLVISSTAENKDNGFVGFHTPDSPETEKRPYLRVIYSLPFMME